MIQNHRRFSPPAALTFLLIGMLAGLGACTSLPKGYSDFDPGTDFSNFRTFAFIPENTMIVASPNPVNPALEPTLKEEVRNHLTRQGYRYTSNPEQADFLVGFAIGGNPTARTTAFIGDRRQVYTVGQTIPTQVVTQESSEGGVVIDFYDQESGEKKWMGWAIQEITMGDLMRLQVTVNEIVGVILGNFPPDV